MKLDGIHHITCITADAPGNVDFYARAARAAAGQEDGQLRRAGRLPPVLRRRARRARLDPDVLRVPRRRAGPRRRGDDPPAALARGLATTRWPSGPSGSRTRASTSTPRRRRRDPLRRPRGARARARASTATDDAPLRARGRRHPRRARAARASTASARTAAGREQEHDVLTTAMGFERDGARRVPPGAASARPPTATTTRPPRSGCRAPAPFTTSPGATATRSTRSGAAAGRRRRAADAGDRPPVLPEHLLPRAARGAVRAGHAEPGLRHRRGSRASGRAASPAAAARAPPRAARGHAHAADQPAREGGPVMSEVTCTHLDQIEVDRPDHVAGCEDCLKIGGTWVHLRVCRTLRPHRLLRLLAQPPRLAPRPRERATRSSPRSSPARTGPTATSTT